MHVFLVSVPGHETGGHTNPLEHARSQPSTSSWLPLRTPLLWKRCDTHSAVGCVRAHVFTHQHKGEVRHLQHENLKPCLHERMIQNRVELQKVAGHDLA